MIRRDADIVAKTIKPEGDGPIIGLDTEHGYVDLHNFCDVQALQFIANRTVSLSFHEVKGGGFKVGERKVGVLQLIFLGVSELAMFGEIDADLPSQRVGLSEFYWSEKGRKISFEAHLDSGLTLEVVCDGLEVHAEED